MVKIEPITQVNLILSPIEAQALYDFLGCLAKADVEQKITGSYFKKMSVKEIEKVLDDIFDALGESPLVTLETR